MAWFKSLRARLYGIVLLAALALFGTSELLLKFSVDNAYHMREQHLRDVTQTAVSILEHLQKQVEQGKMTPDQARETGREELTALHFEGSGYFFVFDTDMVYQAHPHKPEWIGKDQAAYEDVKGQKIFVEMGKIAQTQGGGSLVYYFNNPDTGAVESKLGYVTLFPDWNWIVGTGSYVSDIAASLSHLRTMSLVTMGVSLAILAVISGLLARDTVRQITRIKGRMEAMGAGDTETPVPYITSQTEIGAMARAIEGFRIALIEKADLDRLQAQAEAERHRAEEEAMRKQTELREMQAVAEREAREKEDRLREENEAQRRAADAERRRQMEEQERVVGQLGQALAGMSDGDLTVAIHQAFPESYEGLRRDFNAAIKNMARMAGAIRESAIRLEAETVQIDRASSELGRRTETQAASLEETAAAMNEMSSSVSNALENARNATSAVSRTLQTATDGHHIVQGTVEAMAEIERSSEQINRITSVIDDIAFQTNLLALNAGVEAARAGEAGRGFAVVASEVRALAQRSSEAARDISQLLSTSEVQVRSGVEQTNRSSEALTQIEALIREVDGMVRSIEAGASEQAAGVSEITNAINQLDQVTQQNAAMFEENSAAVRALSAETRSLKEEVSVFRIEPEEESEQRVA
ncbi:methyl-accepting chemotaxis protein [Thioclava sp. GXIMD4215]|uniref:methyl-accepting chemotaxis protein n=1 Tax=Thioclava sp. GXIMD4215 TaxID=3131928 RepID=UPI00311B14EE